MRRALVASALAALVVCSAAAAHGGGGARGFTSSVTRISPPLDGVSAAVLEGDDRLELTNDSGRTVTILGYQHEPYLRFRGRTVYRNSRSPATYLNDDRFGRVRLPPGADPKARPEWEQVSDSSTYEWHDHRIHWMSTTLPPKVAAAKDTPQHVFDWTIPGRVGAAPMTIAGSLDYRPAPGGSFPFLYVIPPLVLLGAASVAWSIRRSRTAPQQTR